MPLLKYLLDTTAISERLRGPGPVREWILAHRDETALSTITVAEMRRGIETQPQTKGRRRLEREFEFVMQDFAGAIWFFDECAAMEWGRLMSESKLRHHPLPYADSLIGAIARSMGAKIVSSDQNGFPGCARIDPRSGAEYARW